MTRGSVKEYVEALRERYWRASRRGKGHMLDEFTQVTGCHRKAAIHLLRRVPKPLMRRRGRQCQYGTEVAVVLKVVWETTSRAVKCFSTTPGRGRTFRVSTCTGSPGSWAWYSLGLRTA